MQILKSAATRTARERQVIVLEHRRLHGNVERPAAASMRRMLKTIGDDVSRRMSEQGKFATVDSLLPVGLWDSKFSNVLTPVMQRGVAMGAWSEWRLIAQLQALHEDEEQKLKIDEFFKAIFVTLPASQKRAITAWIAARTVGVWGKVQQTIREKLRRVLEPGIVDGMPLVDLTEAVQRVIPNATKSTAQRIARTEANGSMNAGHQTIRVVAEVDEKEWISTRDERTRAKRFNHRRPDGQKRPNDQPFSVSGQSLLFPGDASLGASAGNLINCRCTSAASIEAILKPRARRAVRNMGKRPRRQSAKRSHVTPAGFRGLR